MSRASACQQLADWVKQQSGEASEGAARRADGAPCHLRSDKPRTDASESDEAQGSCERACADSRQLMIKNFSCRCPQSSGVCDRRLTLSTLQGSFLKHGLHSRYASQTILSLNALLDADQLRSASFPTDPTIHHSPVPLRPMETSLRRLFWLHGTPIKSATSSSSRSTSTICAPSCARPPRSTLRFAPLFTTPFFTRRS